jgi:hypothetical protein
MDILGTKLPAVGPRMIIMAPLSSAVMLLQLIFISPIITCLGHNTNPNTEAKSMFLMTESLKETYSLAFRPTGGSLIRHCFF